ncbi:uroporphyrinogen-III C-methyltransferase [Cohnella sp. JJ-181]|uniref:uroporphyrinogen-III C-methyltransferase n=1 Tax=Cohnella rhizoplanae TaxID=2974897 RepID=UPI0022FFA145|nr:uroporphyrinogen-III C-methyltransferase [Cohnella sp. JJ-181]CAI6082316.1 Siroheme synthase [Cohnella sp. JJ-181]
MAQGRVYLVGAGPGDPKLITVRGLKALRRCDVVVYDRLAGPQLLQEMRPGAERIYVGKRPDRHTMKQEEINRLLLDLALSGKIVCRLKGGDPTVFGRVGEEAELLRQHGVPYEIVPGITSAIAVPAYAGIPVTHRDLASSFSIVTGHESPDKLDRMIQWDKVTNATGTLLFLMGVAKIGYISEQLMQHGRSADTPVALVRWGTRAEQETLTGTLGDIEEKVRLANFQPPAVIVVGEVVRQRESLKWIESKPLFGWRVLVTRARSQASELAERIDDLGGEPYVFPVIDTVRQSDPAEAERIKAALLEADRYDWVILTSAAGVEHFFSWLAETRVDIRRFARARFAAVGPKTSDALAARGIVPDVIPSEYQAEGLLESLADKLAPGQRALLPRGDLARELLPDELARAGVECVELDVYENRLVVPEEDLLAEMLRDGEIHAVTFTSSSTVVNLLKALRRLGVEQPAELLAGCVIACIGPITARTAEAHGLRVTLTAETSTIEGLLAAMLKHRAPDTILEEERF